jgi:hypothetical protein
VGKATKLAVPQAGQITLKGPPGQTVRLEGKPLGKTPFTAKGLPPGRYTFDVGENWQPTARLNAGQKLTLTPQTPSADSTITWQTARPWVAGGTAAALVLTSTWFFVEASDNWETAVDLAEQYRNTSDAEIRSDLRARAETAAEDAQRNQISGGLTLVGGLAAAGLAWWWFDDAQVAIAPDQVILQVRY